MVVFRTGPFRTEIVDVLVDSMRSFILSGDGRLLVLVKRVKTTANAQKKNKINISGTPSIRTEKNNVLKSSRTGSTKFLKLFKEKSKVLISKKTYPLMIFKTKRPRETNPTPSRETTTVSGNAVKKPSKKRKTKVKLSN